MKKENISPETYELFMNFNKVKEVSPEEQYEIAENTILEAIDMIANQRYIPDSMFIDLDWALTIGDMRTKFPTVNTIVYKHFSDCFYD